MARPTLGMIVGNRGFFPDHLAVTGRQQMLDVLESEGIDVVALTPEDTRFGSTVTLEDAQKCAKLFRSRRDDIIGILITLPNFGEERGIAMALKLADLNVPVLVQAFPDDYQKMTQADRRDSFCGKMSVCNNLNQLGIKFTLTDLHTVAPDSESFRADLRRFVSTCKVVKGLSNCRIGALGARPAAFSTVRFSEKLFERAGISVETLDLSEAFGQAEKLSEADVEVRQKIDRMREYSRTALIPPAALAKMAAFGVVLDRWVKDWQLDATAIQCWTAMEEYFGVVPCTAMSMMSDALMPSGCEVDVAGVVGMYALQLASGRPSALTDWNNNYRDDPNKAVLFHCSNLPASVFAEAPTMDYQAIIAGSVGKDNTYGTMTGRIKTGPFTFLRVMTDDNAGMINAYVGEGKFTDDPLETFGGFGVVEIDDLQGLLKHICRWGFEHHVAINLSESAAAIFEALGQYMDWNVYYHG